MKYLGQSCVILGFSFAGELLQRLLPLPIPAAIYGLLLLFLALCMGLVKLESVEAVGELLISFMPALFVAPAVDLLDCWQLIAPQFLPVCLLVASSTLLTFGAAGRAAQALMGRRKEGGPHG